MKSTPGLSIVAAALAATIFAGGVEIRAEGAPPLERSSRQILPASDMCLEQWPSERARAFRIERRAGMHVVPLNTRGFNHGALELPQPASGPVPASSAR